MSGEIEWEEFLSLIESFLEISKKVGDNWILVGRKEVFGGAYVVKKEERYGTSIKDSSVKYDLEESYLEELLEDVSVVDVKENEKRCRQLWEYHILYSVSYCVPVLYFNAWRNSGELLTLEEIWSEIPDSMKPNESHSYWNLITQQEHPILGKPFFQIHPCQTAKLISSLNDMVGKNIFIPWLTTVGPLLNLHLSPLYAAKEM